MLRARAALSACFVILAVSAPAQSLATPSLMPAPAHISAGQGALALGANFQIAVQAPAGDEITRSGAARLEASMERVSGHPVAVVQAAGPAPGCLVISVTRAATPEIGADESYSLQITPEGAKLDAATSLGALRGMATLRQLVAGRGAAAYLPAVTIKDAPLYPWRGLMIDTARHFIPMDVMERTLDAMELVKLNVLHFHLSDNEGFRVESKVFPRLQEMGSNGQFYTQAQLRAFIHDAALRGIVVVPEFDMPSHAQSWLAGYPELSSSPGPFKAGPVRFDDLPKNPTAAQITKLMATKKFPAIDPTRESTYSFLDRFIGEMTTIFPAPYFHIGADENNGAVWLSNPAIVDFMHAHHIADAPALQAYFVDRVNTLVKQHDRTTVAWEEAYAPTSKIGGVYQVWSPLAKVDLLKTPMPAQDKLLVSRGFYVDIFLPAYVHYLNPDLPATKPEGVPLLGGEAAMWTEMADGSNLEERVWPRAGAVAERLWTPGITADPEIFYQRLFQLSRVLDREGLHQRADYMAGVASLAAGEPTEPVETLLDVLTPLRGYQRLMRRNLTPDAAALPFNQVADIVQVDSETEFRFRAAVLAFLAAPNGASAAPVRTWLQLWAANDARVQPVMARSDRLAKVSGHSHGLAALASFTLGAMDRLQQGAALSPGDLAEADRLLSAASTDEGETQIAVLPEIGALLYGAMPPVPTAYPLF